MLSEQKYNQQPRAQVSLAWHLGGMLSFVHI